MKRIILPLALLATPLAAQETPAEPAVSYDDAVTCAFVTLTVGMSDNSDPEVGIRGIELSMAYLRYAIDLSGKEQQEVIDDVSASGELLAEDIRTNENAVEDFANRFTTCSEQQDLLVPQAAAS